MTVISGYYKNDIPHIFELYVVSKDGISIFLLIEVNKDMTRLFYRLLCFHSFYIKVILNLTFGSCEFDYICVLTLATESQSVMKDD